jgi:Mn2+/Fe2+ NRAMP family transporter
MTQGRALEAHPSRAARGSRRWAGAAVALIGVMGPGLMVMLADTDAGSVITAAQSGATFRYVMVLPELVLIPILYLVQEMTVRLGLFTQRGHAALIKDVFGRRWAMLSAATLFVACVGALVTEFAGVAGVGSLVGLARWWTVSVSAVALVSLVLLGRYRRVEHVGIAIGALELLFLPAAIAAHPHVALIARDLTHPWVTSGGFTTLLAANVGAVIMPWMIFYQQEAVIDRGTRGQDPARRLRSARLDTASGAVVTQVIMVAIVVATAATVGAGRVEHPLNSIGEIASALTPFLGHSRAVLFFGLGMIGASVVAALVVTLAGAWAMSEVLGWRHSLNDTPTRASGFYALAVAGILAGATLVLVVPNLVNLSVDVEILNACLLPIVLGFLLALEARALPAEMRMRGARRAVTYALTALIILFGLATTAVSLGHAF